MIFSKLYSKKRFYYANESGSIQQMTDELLLELVEISVQLKHLGLHLKYYFCWFHQNPCKRSSYKHGGNVSPEIPPPSPRRKGRVVELRHLPEIAQYHVHENITVLLKPYYHSWRQNRDLVNVFKWNGFGPSIIIQHSKGKWSVERKDVLIVLMSWWRRKKTLGRSISQRRLRVFQQSKFNALRLLSAVITQTKTSKTAG